MEKNKQRLTFPAEVLILLKKFLFVPKHFDEIFR